ncbi:penicillin acylase family protein (plasmid) [Streptomyces sp. NBC_01343]|uniref:penicillin acylase family protein n=1 Tax=Streptomyces sp. NBC_01343 TaxID=2903832 RepID=UPI002E16389C|nr:penicillin acylase family protein [Streptomyces sp. NBC_01343]
MSDVMDPLTRAGAPGEEGSGEGAPQGGPQEVRGAAAAPRRSSRWWRRLRVTAWCLAVLLVTVACAAGLAATRMVRASYPQVSGELTVAGLHGKVTVARDGSGVPQIYADDPHDLFLAQGFVHAQDRFWEMDIRRHITSGSLSELFGESQVETDSLIRTMGWRRVAEQEVALLDPQSRANLDAYAAGVNSYLAGHKGADLGVEYPLLKLGGLDYGPAPWTPADSVSWLKAMAWNLNATLSDQVRHALLAATLTDAQVDSLFPTYDFSRWRPIVSPGDSQGTVPEAPAGPAASAAATAPTAATAATAATTASYGPMAGASDALSGIDKVLGPRGSGIGSNSWVVAGSRTTTGKPLLANDPHLSPSMPGVWYQGGLHCNTTGPACPYDVSGFGFAGMPGVIVGHNGDIGWGVTNLAPADTDLFVERITGSAYAYKGEQRPLETRQEVLKVAGGPDRTITVRSTVHGPVISDAFPKAKTLAAEGRIPGVERESGGGAEYAVAMRWSALDPGRTMDAVFQLDTAKDWDSFRAAAALFSSPAQNLVYADRQGHIGYQAPGRIPVRGKGEGRWPVPGWTGEYDWQGFVPFDALPRSFDPASGYIVTANNAAAGPQYPYNLTRNWGDGYRSERIAQLIEKAGKLDATAMQRIQLDDHNENAAALTPYLLAVTPGKDARAAQDLLRGWDFGQGADSAAAAYFNAVWSNLLKLTFYDELDGNKAQLHVDGGGLWYDIVRKLLTSPDDAWWRNAKDPRGLRTRDDVLRAALDDAAKELSGRLGPDPAKWRWGALHTLTLRNDTLGTGGPAPVQWLLNHEPVQVGGGSATVDATGWDASKGYEVNWVPSMRMVVDFADFDASRWINLTGASGHAFNDHYDDQTELWRRGETLPWPSSRSAVTTATKDRLTLRPEGA